MGANADERDIPPMLSSTLGDPRESQACGLPKLGTPSEILTVSPSPLSPRALSLTRRWANLPIVAKGVVVIALPVLTLAGSSALVLSADTAQAATQRRLVAIEAVNA